MPVRLRQLPGQDDPNGEPRPGNPRPPVPDPTEEPLPPVMQPPHVPLPGGPEPGRDGETPRERPTPAPPLGGLPGGPVAAPPRPTFPSPMAGTTSPASTEPGLAPFQPMHGPDVRSLLASRQRSLFGGAQGLTGGGLGVPLDATSNDQSDPIDSLIKSLMGQLGPNRGRL